MPAHSGPNVNAVALLERIGAWRDAPATAVPDAPGDEQERYASMPVLRDWAAPAEPGHPDQPIGR